MGQVGWKRVQQCRERDDLGQGRRLSIWSWCQIDVDADMDDDARAGCFSRWAVSCEGGGGCPKTAGLKL